MSWREDRLHRWIARRERPRALAGSRGHDSAVLRAPRGRGAGRAADGRPPRPVLCLDQTIVGVHVPEDASARRVGRKAAARALSDLAPSAARPRAVLLALCAPPEATEAWMRGVIAAVDERARELGAELVGGDLASAEGAARLSVTALGELEGRAAPPGRDRARPGQVLLLTGPCGGSLLGRHLEPEPRLAEGRWLWERGATAMMDVSDGLALDASRIAEASGVRIDLEEVYAHPDARRAARRSGRTARWHALADGEDYELLATMPRAAWARARGAARRRFPALRAVGRVLRGRGLLAADEDGVLAPVGDLGGWVHG